MALKKLSVSSITSSWSAEEKTCHIEYIYRILLPGAACVAGPLISVFNGHKAQEQASGPPASSSSNRVWYAG